MPEHYRVPSADVKGHAVSKHRLPHRVLVFLAQLLDDKVGWDKLPTWLGIATLVELRKKLREQNLFDTGVAPAKPELADPRWLRARSPDGTYNDLDQPAMGARGVRFGRNVPLGEDLSGARALDTAAQPASDQ